MADDEVKYVHGIDPNEKEAPMELVLLTRLKKMFPCTNESSDESTEVPNGN